MQRNVLYSPKRMRKNRCRLGYAGLGLGLFQKDSCFDVRSLQVLLPDFLVFGPMIVISQTYPRTESKDKR